MTSNEDFLFAQEAVALGFVTDAQVKEALELQRRMAEDLRLDERLAVLLVKRGYLAEDQARRVYAKIQPGEGGPGEIHGYRLLEVVGRGAMGTVYRAQHLGLNKTVAIKILRPDLAGDKTQIERLKAEAAMLASLDHPNIVRALDAGESNGFPYVVMEYVEGESLRDRLRREGPFPEAEALRITRALADALERARRMGVVHRDVKPGNVLLTKAGAPKLMDLGLAKGPIDLGLTQHGATVGTPQYIAPEQALDPKKADTRSDIYALGATLYAMLTGEPPFDGKTLAEILTKVLYEVPVPVRTRRPEVSPETGYLVERMMLRDPSLRYRTPAMVVHDIDRLTQGTSILPKGFSGNWEAFLLRKRVRKTTIWVAAAAAVVVVAGLLWQVGGGFLERKSERERIAATADALRDGGTGLDSKPAILGRIAQLEPLLEDARRTGADRTEWVAPELDRLRAEVARYDALEAVLEGDVKAAEETEDYATADTRLSAHIATMARGPARAEADRRLARLRERSDLALKAYRSEHAFPATPRDVTDVAAAAGGWYARLGARYAPTPAQVEETQRAHVAKVAAERIAQSVREGRDALLDSELDQRVDGLEFAPAVALITAKREAAARTLKDEGEPLTAGEHRYVAPGTLARLVAEPFDERQAALDAKVERAWIAARDRAEKTKTSDPAASLALLERFTLASSPAYPRLAQEARKTRDDIEVQTHAARAAGEAALAALVRNDVVPGLRSDDLSRVEKALAAAKADVELYRPVARRLDELERVVPTVRQLRERAFSELGRRRGPDEKLYFERLAFRDRVETKVEIVSVSSEDRTFEFRTHKGHGVQPAQRARLLDVSDDAQFELAQMDPKSAEGGPLHGILAIAGLPVLDDDFYEAIKALDEAIRRFRNAQLDETSPLFAWAIEERAERVSEAAKNEEIARKTLEAARTDLLTGVPPSEEARKLRSLLDRREEPSLKLPLTQVVKAAEKEIRDRLAVATGKLKLRTLEEFWPGARIARVGGAAAGVLDIDATFNFDGSTPLSAFLVAGWARREKTPDGPRRVLTPGNVPNMSLRLMPGAGRETVADRPVVWASVFEPRAARAISFEYWPESPLALVIDLDGVQVAVVSDDPRGHPLPLDAPLFEREKPPTSKAPLYDSATTGRGVRFHAGPEIGDPARWGWDDAFRGHHFLPPLAPSVGDKLATEYFAFEPGGGPYLVKLSWDPETGARLEVGERLVAADPKFAAPNFVPNPSGKIQILSYTTCLIDEVKLTGRVSAAWLKQRENATSPTPSNPPTKSKDN